MLGSGLARQNFYFAVVLCACDRVAIDLKHARQRWTRSDHCLASVADDRRLISTRCTAVNFRTVLAAGKKRPQRKARNQCALAVLAGDLDVCRAIAASAVGALPSDQVADDRLLPRLQLEGLTSPLAFAVLQCLRKECESRVGFSLNEVIAVARSCNCVVAGQVVSFMIRT